MKVKLQAQLLKVSSKSDRSYALTFNTRELRGIDAAALLDDLMNEGWLIWSPNDDIGEADIPEERAESGIDVKTPARRLRDRMFIFYREVKRGKPEDFNNWYESELERIGQAFLDKVHE